MDNAAPKPTEQPARSGRRALWLAWVIVALAIPCLSAFGRPLQHWVFGHFGETAAAWVIGLLLAGMGGGVVLRMARYTLSGRPLVLACWTVGVVAALAAIILLLPHTEERLHFVTFGLLGFLSRQLMPLGLDVLAVMAWAGGDELFQAWLPDRVGDWRDVWMNAIAGIAGLAAALAARRR